jgi:hypothetical protein
MKIFSGTFKAIIFLMLITGCNGKRTVKNDTQTAIDTTTIADTGYTGIKQYTSGGNMIKEVTFKNGIREGLMKSFYKSGRVRQTFWYHNGLREDSARWLYEEGEVFRTTPYKNDTIDGIQKQFYRNGRLKAKLGFSKGFRTTYLEEFTPEGKIVKGYPELVTTINDQYKTRGIYRISLGMSNKSTYVKFYRGEFTNGVFDSTRCKRIEAINGVAFLDLEKTGSPKSGSVGIIAQVLTNFNNNYLIYKKIELPYNDLK